MAVELIRVLDDYLADLQAGKQADRTAVLAAHPQLAGQLEQCLAGIEFIHRAGHTTGEVPAQLGDFRIRREIGRGGMGVVFEAEQLSLHRTVALKILRFGVADKEALERFRYEAETVAKLHHTNIVPIFAIGCEQGVNFYAMQYIQGRSLADVIERRTEVRGLKSEVGGRRSHELVPPLAAGSHGHQPAPPAKARAPMLADIAGWSLQAAEALAHAHGRGVIHRDIKPSNLLLDDEGTLWLTDFGLAKRMDEVTLTLTGAILGTPRYMSPEQAAASRQPVDHRTDIYSLGATLYELVTGQPAFAAATPHEVISQIITTEPRPPRQFDRSLPRDLETIVLKCLAKEPGRRYQTAHELANDLRAFLEGRPIAARRVGVVERATRWVKRRRKTAIAMAAAAACGAALLVGGLLAWHWHEELLLGHLNISTSGPTLVAEVLDKDDRSVVPNFPVPSLQPIALHEGSYHVRLSSPGILSQMYPLEVERGSRLSFDLRLEDRSMWPPVELKPGDAIEPIHFVERTDLLIFSRSDSSLRRLDGATGKPVWSEDLVLKQSNVPKGENADDWRRLFSAPWFSDPGSNACWQPDWLVAQSADRDDGDGDLILASRIRPALIAISGNTGKVQWVYRSRPHPFGAKDVRVEPAAESLSPSQTAIFGRPVVAEPAPGQPALVVAGFFSGDETWRRPDGSTLSMARQVWLEAISVKTGAPVWRDDKILPSWNYDRQDAARKGIGQPHIARVGTRKVVVCAIESGSPFAVDLESGKEIYAAFDSGYTVDGAPAIVNVRSPAADQYFDTVRRFWPDMISVGDGTPALLMWGHPDARAIAAGVKKPLFSAFRVATRGGGWGHDVDVLSWHVDRAYQPDAQKQVDVARLGPKDAPVVVAALPHLGDAHKEIMPGIVRAQPGVDLLVLDAETGERRWEKPLFTTAQSAGADSMARRTGLRWRRLPRGIRRLEDRRRADRAAVRGGSPFRARRPNAVALDARRYRKRRESAIADALVGAGRRRLASACRPAASSARRPAGHFHPRFWDWPGAPDAVRSVRPAHGRSGWGWAARAALHHYSPRLHAIDDRPRRSAGRLATPRPNAPSRSAGFRRRRHRRPADRGKGSRDNS